MQLAQLNLVIRLAGEQRDEAAQRLAAGRQQWQGANQQLEQLQKVMMIQLIRNIVL